MSPFLEGYVRARRSELGAAPGSDSVVDEIVRPSPTARVRYRLGRGLVALGAQLMGPTTPVLVVETESNRRAA